jgi:hypothetical protein
MADLRRLHPHSTLHTIPKNPSISIIKNTRAQATGSDVYRAIETMPTVSTSDNDPRPFLQFSVVHSVGGHLRRFLGFGHPDLVRLLWYRGTALYIDGTFKMAPKPFTQCLVLMVRDPSVDLYVPALYVLVTSKDQETYWNVLDAVIIQTDRLLEPASVTCDFEKGLMNAIIEQFLGVNIVGCLFHWKQALRRKMLELRIARPQIAAALTPDVIDVLITIIPVDEIPSKVHFFWYGVLHIFLTCVFIFIQV